MENETGETENTEVETTGAEEGAGDSGSAGEKADAGETGEENEEGSGDAADDGEKEIRTIRRALDKRNRYINNQRQRIRVLEDEIQKIRQARPGESAAPQMDKFESVLDYVKADQAYMLDQKLAEQSRNQRIDDLKRQADDALNQQSVEIGRQVAELMEKAPDFRKVIAENTGVIHAMPPHIESLMAEIDDAPAATYALAKEGRLQSLYSMPPHLAAAHLVQAEIRGQQYLKSGAAPAARQAPRPLGALKGTGTASTGKPLGRMSPTELDKWYRS